ncbi:MAG: acyltransferase family protein [Pararhodobacter sp.]
MAPDQVRTSFPAALSRRVEAATPAERDRYLDFLRVTAILLVIFGHWMVRVIVAPDGVPEARYLLAEQPAWHWATLVFQVMPVIFLVAGALNAKSWRRARKEGASPVQWVRRRARRLLRPTAVFQLVVVPAWLIAVALARDTLLLQPGVALVPLWFIAAYMAIMALTPVSMVLHDKGFSWPAIAAAVLLSVAIDLARLGGHGPVLGTQPLVGVPNFLLIWVAIHQLGHLWADDQLPARPAAQAGLALAGAGALALLVGAGPWPLTMIPVEGTFDPNNAAPPTVALFALALVQLGLVLLLRPPIRRALGRPWVWTPVALVGARLMTLFLWHQAAMVVVSNLAAQQGWLPLTGEIDARWWAHQPIWVAAFALVLVGLLAFAGRFEEPRDKAAPDHAGWGTTMTGIALAGGAIAGFLWLGVTDLPAWLALGFLALFLVGYRMLHPQG